MESSTPYYRAWPPGTPVRQAVIARMPAGVVTRTAEARAVTVLLELSDNSVWAVGIPFDISSTEAGLFAVAEYLSGQEDCPTTRAWQSECGSFALGFRLEILNPTLDPDAKGFWKVRECAIAEVLGSHLKSGMSNLGELVVEKEAANLAAVADGLARLTGNLNQEALVMATLPGGFCSTRYNFLARAVSAEQIAYRGQFARTFPVLVPWILAETGEPTSHTREIHEAIDSGKPLVPLIAAGFQVPQNVVRYLVNKGEDFLGADWNARLPVLLRVLSSIAPEKRPKDRAEWGALTSACELLSQLLGRPITTPLSLSWLCRALKRDFSGLVDIMDGADPRTVVVAIDELTDAIEIALFWELGRRDPAENAIERKSLCRAAISKFVLAHDPLFLYQRALRWRAEYNRAIGASGPETRPANTWRTVLMGPLKIGDLSVIELDSASALAEEGKRLDHCVGTYQGVCSSGLTHIFSVRDAEGQSLSTAEIRLAKRRDGAMACTLIQHHSRNDSKPGWQCSEVIGELLRMLDDEPYSSRMLALYLTRKGNGFGIGGPPKEADEILATVDSVRKVLEGHGRYETFIRDASEKKVSAPLDTLLFKQPLRPSVNSDSNLALFQADAESGC